MYIVRRCSQSQILSLHGEADVSPNQRKAGKKKIGAYISIQEQAELQRLVDSLGMSQSDVIKLALREYAKHKGVKHAKHGEKVVRGRKAGS